MDRFGSGKEWPALRNGRTPRPAKKYRVDLTAEERETRIGLIRYGNAAARQVTRARILVDFIRNNDLYHNLSLRFRYRTRRLCKPQAISMSRSAMPSLVLRNTSFILRERFTPARACSTRTRRREIFRFARFSAFVSSPCRGFFSAAASARPRVRTPESPCPWRG
jgi:hypothetical protein